MSESKATRLRKAILCLYADDTQAREITVEDVQRRWSFLSSSGYGVIDIVKIANSDDIDEAVFSRLMKCLNSHL